MPGFPFVFRLGYSPTLKQYYLTEGIIFKSDFTIEELEEMLAWLKEQNKELKNRGKEKPVFLR